MTRQLLTLTVLACIWAIGCSRSKTSEEVPSDQSPETSVINPAASIAVIDLEQIAQEVGASHTVERVIKNEENKIQGLIAEVILKHETEYIELKNSFGTNPTTDQLDQLLALKADHDLDIKTKRRSYENGLIIFRNKMRVKFLEEVKPIANRCGMKKGFSIVLSTGQFFTADKTVDITAEVIDEIKKINAEAFSGPAQSKSERISQIPDGGSFQPRR